MKIKAACAYLDVSRPTLKKWLDAGLIVFKRSVSGGIDISNASIEEFKHARLARINSRRNDKK